METHDKDAKNTDDELVKRLTEYLDWATGAMLLLLKWEFYLTQGPIQIEEEYWELIKSFPKGRPKCDPNIKSDT